MARPCRIERTETAHRTLSRLWPRRECGPMSDDEKLPIAERARNLPTAEEVRAILRYDPKTGYFFWLRDKCGHLRGADQIHAGDRAGFDMSGYTYIGISGLKIASHKLAWLLTYGVWPEGELDHRDLNRANCAIQNLRPATSQQNKANTPRYKNNKSGFKGVHRFKDKWRAMIRIDRKSRHLGLFRSPEEAHAAYCAAARELFGDFARF